MGLPRLPEPAQNNAIVTAQNRAISPRFVTVTTSAPGGARRGDTERPQTTNERESGYFSSELLELPGFQAETDTNLLLLSQNDTAQFRGAVSG